MTMVEKELEMEFEKEGKKELENDAKQRPRYWRAKTVLKDFSEVFTIVTVRQWTALILVSVTCYNDQK